jgi:hypothetical protein
MAHEERGKPVTMPGYIFSTRPGLSVRMRIRPSFLPRGHCRPKSDFGCFQNYEGKTTFGVYLEIGVWGFTRDKTTRAMAGRKQAFAANETVRERGKSWRGSSAVLEVRYTATGCIQSRCWTMRGAKR